MIGEIIDLASDAHIVEKSGAWYSYNGDKLGQGKEAVKEFLKKNNKLKEEIEIKVREHYGILKNEKKETTKKSDD